MKRSALLLVLVCALIDNVNTDFIDNMSEKFQDWSSKIFSNIKIRVENLFEQHKSDERFKVIPSPRVTKKPSIVASYKRPASHEKFDPSVLMSTPQLATFHGRRMETHTIVTEDGYFLTLHNLPVSPKIANNRTVLLHHGILGSSADWLLLGRFRSLPYLLSDIGFDVWLTNARGNYYSRGHASDRYKPQYWNFTWQEMGEYDLPAVISYITELKADGRQIDYVGHSMGATALLVLLSNQPEFNKIVRTAVLLAPLAHMTDVRGFMAYLTKLSMKVSDNYILRLLGQGLFLPRYGMRHKYVQLFGCCHVDELICQNPLFALAGHPYHYRWDESMLRRVTYHVPSGGSTRTITHYLSCAQVGQFKDRFTGTEFSLQRISSKIAIVSSSNDLLSSISDAEKIMKRVLNPIGHYIIHDHNISHTDFVWGIDAKGYIFDKVIQFLEPDYLHKGERIKKESKHEKDNEIATDEKKLKDKNITEEIYGFDHGVIGWVKVITDTINDTEDASSNNKIIINNTFSSDPSKNIANSTVAAQGNGTLTVVKIEINTDRVIPLATSSVKPENQSLINGHKQEPLLVDNNTLIDSEQSNSKSITKLHRTTPKENNTEPMLLVYNFILPYLNTSHTNSSFDSIHNDFTNSMYIDANYYNVTKQDDSGGNKQNKN